MPSFFGGNSEDSLPEARRPQTIPADVRAKLTRGRSRSRRESPKRNECLEFFRNNQYVHLASTGTLIAQNTTVGRTDGTGHRIRQTRNMIMPIVRREVSAATSRVPSYDVIPSTSDPERVSAAKTSEKVAVFGYEDWGINEAMRRLATYAVVADEGFIWPYYDPDANLGEGNLRMRVYGPSEVGWEPGAKFEESRWYYIDQAMPIEEAEALPGFDGFKLHPDATASENLGDKKRREDEQNLVMVTEFLERPCEKYPAGRRMIVANGRIICPEEDYPLRDSKGKALDEPVLHKLSYITDPESDRDLGLVRFLLDPQRAYNVANNKQQEFMVLAMNPQVIVKNGILKQRLTDAPGAKYDFVGSGDVMWRPIPQMPPDYEAVKQQALNDLLRIASQNDVPQGIESGKALETFIQNDQNVRQEFLDKIAKLHGRLMRHCLILVQLHFSKPRLLQINGEWGPDPIENFTGAQLKDQSNVRVTTASIEPLTRDGMAQRITLYMQQGWVDPQKGISAIENGTPELIIDDYERDKATAHRFIQLLMAGPEVFLQEPLAPSPDGTMDVPSWMPREFDNLPVIKHEVTSWMKSDGFWNADPVTQEAANLYYQGIVWLEEQQQQKAMMAQAAQAEQLGMNNAAKPGDPGKVLPSQPKLG